MDETQGMERLYRTTWLCSQCGLRHPMSVSVCDNCMNCALEADEQKLRDLCTDMGVAPEVLAGMFDDRDHEN